MPRSRFDTHGFYDDYDDYPTSGYHSPPVSASSGLRNGPGRCSRFQDISGTRPPVPLPRPILRNRRDDRGGYRESERREGRGWDEHYRWPFTRRREDSIDGGDYRASRTGGNGDEEWDRFRLKRRRESSSSSSSSSSEGRVPSRRRRERDDENRRRPNRRGWGRSRFRSTSSSSDDRTPRRRRDSSDERYRRSSRRRKDRSSSSDDSTRRSASPERRARHRRRRRRSVREWDARPPSTKRGEHRLPTFSQLRADADLPLPRRRIDTSPTPIYLPPLTRHDSTIGRRPRKRDLLFLTRPFDGRPQHRHGFRGRLADALTNTGPDVFVTRTRSHGTLLDDRPRRWEWGNRRRFEDEGEMETEIREPRVRLEFDGMTKVREAPWARRRRGEVYNFRSRRYGGCEGDGGAWLDARWRPDAWKGNWPEQVRCGEGRVWRRVT